MSKEEKRTRDIMPSDPTDPNEAEPQSEGGQEADNVDRSKVLDDLGATDVPDMQSDIHVLTIIGQVEGHLVMPSQNKTTKYEHVIPQLVAVEESPEIKGLLVVLNTVGGDVEAGLVHPHIEHHDDVLNDLPEGQGDNGQIVPPEPQHRHAHQQSEKAGEGGTHHHGDQ